MLKREWLSGCSVRRMPDSGQLAWAWSARHMAPVALYVIITLVWCRPLLADFTSLVPSDLGDPLLSVWAIWWNAHVIPFTAEWWNGLAFFPAPGMMTFSDHRVGVGVFTSPLIWVGASPLLAYNVAFMLSFILSACAAYALAVEITANRIAAFIAGLVFGFHPFRAEHLSHLELLAAYWLPIILLALHRWVATMRERWLVLASCSLLMQALTGGYYFVYAAPLLGLWLLWFVPRMPPRQYIALIAALLLPLALMAPVFMKYRDVHRELGLTRSQLEIEFFSADVRGLASAPERLLFWDTPDTWTRPEGRIFPGVTAVLLIGIAAVVSRKKDIGAVPQRITRLRRLILLAVVIAIGIAIPPLTGHPLEGEIAGVPISMTHPYKGLSIGLILFALWFVLSPSVSLKRQSAFPFYVFATLAMWLFALGPVPKWGDERVLWTAPYSWAMMLPGFSDGFRVPSRFAMLAALTLSGATALAWARLAGTQRGAIRIVGALIVTVGIMLDGWIVPLPVVAAPERAVIPDGLMPSNAVVLELPLGVFEDATAMYRSIFHGHRTVNGMSGYEPPHYSVLRTAVTEGRYEPLIALANSDDVVIAVRKESGQDSIVRDLQNKLPAQALASTAQHDILLLPRARSETQSRFVGTPITARAIRSEDNSDAVRFMSDRNMSTHWTTSATQQGHERFIADLGRTYALSGIMLAQRSPGTFPRAIVVEVSVDDVNWEETWRGETSTLALQGAIAHPRDGTFTIPLTTRIGMYVRVTQIGVANFPWTVAEFKVLTGPN
jgi:hypothetical protein